MAPGLRQPGACVYLAYAQPERLGVAMGPTANHRNVYPFEVAADNANGRGQLFTR